MASPGLPRYEVIYGVQLLDDMHNYFPALLYDHSRFQSVTQIFHYVRHQLNSRFNLYGYGARQAGYGVNEEREDAPTPTPTPNAPHPPTSNRILNSLNATTVLLDLLNLGLNSPVRNEDVPNLFFTTNTMGGNRTPAQIWTSFRQPVVVRPTTETIQRTTRILTSTEIPVGTICSICQEGIAQTETARKIIHCDHMYHQVCIDQWFERSVLCPTCRFDIRETLRGQTN